MKIQACKFALALLSSSLLAGMARAEGEAVPSGHGFKWPELTFSGFGTLGAVVTDTNEGEYIRESQARGATKDPSALVDSNLGLQVNAKVNSWLSGTVQTLTAQRTENSLSTRFDWAFVKVTPIDGLAIRAGKFSLPNFLISDTRRVGYANTSLRPSNEVYGLDLLNGGLKGGDISYRQPVGDNALTVTGLYGKSALKSAAQTIDVKNVKGLNLVWDGDWYTVRLGRITAEPQLSAGSDVYKFTGVGATVDRADVVLQAEYVQRRSSQYNFAIGADAWYLLGGYRFGKMLPYAMVAERKPDGVTFVDPQKSIALGLRWDAYSSAAIKFQLERIRTEGTAGASFITPSVIAAGRPPVRQGLSGPVTTFSVALDFVF